MNFFNAKKDFSQAIKECGYRCGLSGYVIEKDYYIYTLITELKEKTTPFVVCGDYALLRGYYVGGRHVDVVEISPISDNQNAEKGSLKIIKDLMVVCKNLKLKATKAKNNCIYIKYRSKFDYLFGEGIIKVVIREDNNFLEYEERELFCFLKDYFLAFLEGEELEVFNEMKNDIVYVCSRREICARKIFQTYDRLLANDYGAFANALQDLFFADVASRVRGEDENFIKQVYSVSDVPKLRAMVKRGVKKLDIMKKAIKNASKHVEDYYKHAEIYHEEIVSLYYFLILSDKLAKIGVNAEEVEIDKEEEKERLEEIKRRIINAIEKSESTRRSENKRVVTTSA